MNFSGQPRLISNIKCSAVQNRYSKTWPFSLALAMNPRDVLEISAWARTVAHERDCKLKYVNWPTMLARRESWSIAPCWFLRQVSPQDSRAFDFVKSPSPSRWIGVQWNYHRMINCRGLLVAPPATPIRLAISTFAFTISSIDRAGHDVTPAILHHRFI